MLPLCSLPVGFLCSLLPLSVRSLCLLLPLASLPVLLKALAPRALCRAPLEDLLVAVCKQGCVHEVVLVAGVPAQPPPDKLGIPLWVSKRPPA